MTIEMAPAPKAVNIALLTISDTRTPDTDTSGDILESRIRAAGHTVVTRSIVSDEVDRLQSKLKEWIDNSTIDAIISTGGTGLTGRDITPEAVLPMLDKVIDGFSAVFHQVSFRSIGLSTIQSRAFAGLSKGTIIFCLPGSNGAVKDGWDEIISHQLNSTYRPCNLVELMPRFLEK